MSLSLDKVNRTAIKCSIIIRTRNQNASCSNVPSYHKILLSFYKFVKLVLHLSIHSLKILKYNLNVFPS